MPDPPPRTLADALRANGLGRAPAGSLRALAESQPVERPTAKQEPTPDEPGTLNLERIAAEAARFAPGPFGYFLWVDARRIAASFPPISNWWRWSIGEFYNSNKPWGWWEVGRGGGKSTTLECVAAERSVFGERKVPPGQMWTWPFVSVGPDDANRRINGIAAVYRAIGLPVVGDEADGKKIKRGEGVKIVRAPRGALELCDARGNEIALASIAGTIGNVSGPSTIGAIVDEAAKLYDKSTNANPLTELVASLSQTSRARAGWKAIVCSSAWERSGLHFEVIDAAEREEEGESNFVARIGEDFIEETRRGFYEVAAWERGRGDHEAADIIKKHADSLTPRSPHVPTFTANPTLGNPDAVPWAGAALASRKLVEVLPERALDGLPRVLFWLRENGSVALNRGNGVSPVTLDDARFIAAQNFALSQPWKPPRKQSDDGMFDYGPADDAGPVKWRGL